MSSFGQQQRNSVPGIWTGQALHYVCLGALLALVLFAWRLVGHPSPRLFWISIAVPIIHQVFVWLSWRLELRSSTVSKSIGFQAYLVLFFALLSGRVLTVFILAWSDSGSLNLPPALRIVGVLVLSPAWIYTAYSLNKYFGFKRAAGGDHFHLQYRETPLVRKGMFRLSGNAMYAFGFLLFWTIAIGFDSVGALVVTAFSHAYVWVNYHATEKPDMRYLYAHEPAE